MPTPRTAVPSLLLLVMVFCAIAKAEAIAPPNIIFIMADDLGYGDLGCYGQRRIRTPNIDRLASEGMRFTSCYAGCTVCAPSRCTLMTGMHTGHARVRSNTLVPLQPQDTTVAEVLKDAGYATGIVGKWGLGEPNTSGVPTRQGFDTWFGYLNQRHAHNYYPDHLWRGEERLPLDNIVSDGVASKKTTYSADLFGREALAFVEQHKDDRFFLYFAATLPHANNEAGKQGMEVPTDAPYTNESWPQPQKNHAAMITYLDAQVGCLLEKVQELGIDEKTIIFFTSDNGPHREGGADPEFFNSSGPLRGFKRALYEGGIRVPMIVRYPGKIEPGTTNDTPWAFWDVLPTLAELAGTQVPDGIDGISMVPTLLGEAAAGHGQAPHGYFYWEFPERGFRQALRIGNWKIVKNSPDAELELYDLATDIAEHKNAAAEHADVIEQAIALLKTARTRSDYLQFDQVHTKKRSKASE